MMEHDAGPRSSAEGPPDPTWPVITAAHVAVAIVAACGVTGMKPERAFNDGDGQGRTRVMAAAGCIARLDWDKGATARVFRVHPNRLTPSGLVIARVFTEHLLVVGEALAAHGLTGNDRPRTRFLRPYGPGPGVTSAAPVADRRCAVERVKPVNDRIVRWTRQQLALGADIEFVADCFGVDVEALSQRVRPDVGVAA